MTRMFNLGTFLTVASLNFSRLDGKTKPTPGDAFSRNKEGHIDANLSKLVKSFLDKGGYDQSVAPNMIFVPVAHQGIDLADQKARKAALQDLLDWLDGGADLSGDSLKVKIRDIDLETGEPGTRTLSIPVSKVADKAREVYKDASDVTHVPLSGNRRNVAILFYLVACDIMEREPLQAVPGEERSYQSVKDLITASSAFNSDARDGELPPSKANKFAAGFRMFDEGCKQTHMRDAFKAGTGQLIWRTCVLDVLRPDWNVRAGSIEGASFGNKEQIKKMIDLCAVDKHGLKVSKLSAQQKRAQDPDIAKAMDEMLVAIRNDTAEKRKKSAKRGDLIEYQARHKVSVVKDVLAAVADNKLDRLAPLQAKADALNTAFDAVMAGDDLAPACYLRDDKGQPQGEPLAQAQLDEIVVQLSEALAKLDKLQELATGKATKSDLVSAIKAG